MNRCPCSPCPSGHCYALARANSAIADSAAANRYLQIGGMEVSHQAPPFVVIVRTSDRFPRLPRADAWRSFSNIAGNTFAAAGGVT
jgi:hypothetical protein